MENSDFLQGAAEIEARLRAEREYWDGLKKDCEKERRAGRRVVVQRSREHSNGEAPFSDFANWSSNNFINSNRAEGEPNCGPPQSDPDQFAESESFWGLPFFAKRTFSENELNIVGKIRKEAPKILTQKQLTVFEYLILEGHTETETAQLLGTTQPDINKTKVAVIKKIKRLFDASARTDGHAV